MYNFSENYQLRQYYIQENKAPSQSMMKAKMSPNLANVIFKLMTPKFKVVSGLEPSLKGGESDWYVCPKENLLNNRSILKPIKHAYLNKLNYSGIVHCVSQVLFGHHKIVENEKIKRLQESNDVWKKALEKAGEDFWFENVDLQIKNNTEFIKNIVNIFSVMYRTSITNMEMLLNEGLNKDIKKAQELTHLEMKNRYDHFLRVQAISLTDEAKAKLAKENARLKSKFIESLEICRTEMTNKLHNINLEKYAIAEKLRTFLEYQKLACQVNVSLKEKEKCFKEMEESKLKHKKIGKPLTNDRSIVEAGALLAKQRERKLQEINSVWLTKVTHTLKMFLMLVSYCLSTLPDHAEFFINMEKIMLLQVNKSLENPTAESILSSKVKDKFHEHVSQPKPFYLFCDKGYKARVDEDLCPKHGSTASASQLPAIIINKRCLYAACDNFEQFTSKIKDYIRGNRGDDVDIKDDLVYEHFVPVKCTSSQQPSEIKLEGSLIQVLQQEMSNMEKVLPGACTTCGRRHCFCTLFSDTEKLVSASKKITNTEVLFQPSDTEITSLASVSHMEHDKEPKIDSYMKYIEPKVCNCAKTYKKKLEQHLPAYMRKCSKYDTVEIPNYETCSVNTLKKLVNQAKYTKPKILTTVKTSPETKHVSTQYADKEFNYLCACFSNISKVSCDSALQNKFELEKMSPSYMSSKPSTFAIDRAHSLRKLIDIAPELKELLFNKKN